MSGKKPEYRVRIGSVIASVWKNETDGRRPFHTVSVQRTYKENDETKYSESFSLGDLANLQRVLAIVQDSVEGEEAVIGE
jgi:hypothetical protein